MFQIVVALSTPALNGSRAIFETGVIRAGVNGPGFNWAGDIRANKVLIYYYMGGACIRNVFTSEENITNERVKRI